MCSEFKKVHFQSQISSNFLRNKNFTLAQWLHKLWINGAMKKPALAELEEDATPNSLIEEVFSINIWAFYHDILLFFYLFTFTFYL